MNKNKIRHSFWFRTRAIVVVCLFLLNNIPIIDSAHALAPRLASQSPLIKQQIRAALERTQVIYAESEEVKRLLDANHADALLLSHGKYLVRKEVAGNPLRLIRAIIHEDIEVLMQILEKDDRYRYNGIKELIFNNRQVKQYYCDLCHDGKEPRHLTKELMLNDIIAKALEIMFMAENGLVVKEDYKSREEQIKEARFYLAMRPIIMSKRHNYFRKGLFISQEDSIIRSSTIKRALAKGVRFYQVTSQQNNSNIQLGRSNIEESISQIQMLLNSIDGKETKRKDITPKIRDALLHMQREGNNIFSARQAFKIARIGKLAERVNALRLLCEEKTRKGKKKTFRFKGYHIALILHSSRKEKEIQELIETLKSLGITEGTHIALILQSSRKEKEIQDYVTKLISLKQAVKGFTISNIAIVTFVINPKWVKSGFDHMLRVEAKLPSFYTPISEQTKTYVKFRNFLRNLPLQVLNLIIDMNMNIDEAKKLKQYLRKEVERDKALLNEILIRLSDNAELDWHDTDYETLGLLLFSFDESIRIAARNKLASAHFGEIGRFRTDEKQSMAQKILLQTSERFNIYYHQLRGKPHLLLSGHI